MTPVAQGLLGARPSGGSPSIRSADRARWCEWVFRLYLLLFCLGMFVYTLDRPVQNWDMVAYVGAAKAWDSNDKQVVHDFAYTGLRNYVTDQQYADLTVNSGYRNTYFEDPEAFWQSLAWYRIRPVYTGALNLLDKAGMNMFYAAHLIPAMATLLGVCVFYLAFRSYVSGLFWYSLPFFLIMNGTIATARLATPDGLAFLGVAVATLLFLRRHPALFWVLPLLVFLRTDLIILVGLMLGYRFVVSRADRSKALISVLVATALYLAINHWAGNHGWKAVFYLVFVSGYDLNYPATTEVTVTLADYFSALKSRVPILLQSDEFATYAAVTTLVSALVLRLYGLGGSIRRALAEPLYALPLIGLMYVGVHFLAFPAGMPRFYAAHYTAAFLVLLAILTRLCRQLNKVQE